GCIEHTNLVPPEHYGGQRLLYVINYLRPDHPYMRLRSEDLLRIHLPSLARLYPGFEASLVERKFVFRPAVASPLYDLGFRGRARASARRCCRRASCSPPACDRSAGRGALP